MRIGLFSDPHANLEALRVVVDWLKAQGAELYFCLGDLVGYGANPNECIGLIQELPGLVVAGNHDWAVLERTPLEYFNPIAAQAVRWTRRVLNSQSVEFLKSIKLTHQHEGFYLVHSTPSDPTSWRYILDLEEAGYQFTHFPTRTCLVGHSHCPFLLVSDGNCVESLPLSEVRLEPEKRYLINLGSVGQPRDGDPRACAAIYHPDLQVIRFVRLDYDIRLAQEKIIRAGLPPYLAQRLWVGR